MRRRTSTLRPALCAGLLSLTLLLTGCAEDEPKPKFEEPAASPTPEAETAEEFIERWNDEQNKMIAGEPNEWRELTRQCTTCQASADRAESYYKAGGHVTTAGRRVLSVSQVTSEGSKIVYRVRIDSAPTTYQASADEPEQRLEGGISTYQVQLKDSPQGWIFLDYAEVPE